MVYTLAFCIGDCGEPLQVMNGKVSSDGRIIGSRATYECDEGYHMSSGSPRRLCLPDGNWSGNIPSCTGENILYLSDTLHVFVDVSVIVSLGSTPWLLTNSNCFKHVRN